MKTKVNLKGPKGRISALLQLPALAEAGYKKSVLHILEGENHFLSKRRPEVISLSVEFLKDKLK